MHRKLTIPGCTKTIGLLFVLMLAIGGCSSGSSDLASEVSGKYQHEQGDGAVDINLAKDSSTLIIDGQTFKGVVDKIDKGSNTIQVKVEVEGGATEVWSIHQVWNDNGSEFKLNLRRNGVIETLIPVGRS